MPTCTCPTRTSSASTAARSYPSSGSTTTTATARMAATSLAHGLVPMGGSTARTQVWAAGDLGVGRGCRLTRDWFGRSSVRKFWAGRSEIEFHNGMLSLLGCTERKKNLPYWTGTEPQNSCRPPANSTWVFGDHSSKLCRHSLSLSSDQVQPPGCQAYMASYPIAQVFRAVMA